MSEIKNQFAGLAGRVLWALKLTLWLNRKATALGIASGAAILAAKYGLELPDEFVIKLAAGIATFIGAALGDGYLKRGIR